VTAIGAFHPREARAQVNTGIPPRHVLLPTVTLAARFEDFALDSIAGAAELGR
jgi:hypothetical protein